MIYEILNYFGFTIITMSSAPEGQVGDTKYKYQCQVCEKKFDSLYILNYHRILEHSKSRRPPIGIG
jgi:hypothetical protein